MRQAREAREVRRERRDWRERRVRCAERGERGTGKIRFELPSPLSLSFSVSHAQRFKRLHPYLSVPVAQLAFDTEQKIVGSIL